MMNLIQRRNRAVFLASRCEKALRNLRQRGPQSHAFLPIGKSGGMFEPHPRAVRWRKNMRRAETVLLNWRRQAEETQILIFSYGK